MECVGARDEGTGNSCWRESEGESACAFKRVREVKGATRFPLINFDRRSGEKNYIFDSRQKLIVCCPCGVKTNQWWKIVSCHSIALLFHGHQPIQCWI